MCLRLHIRYSANLIPKWLLLTKLDKYALKCHWSSDFSIHVCLRLHIRYSENLTPNWFLLAKLDKYALKCHWSSDFSIHVCLRLHIRLSANQSLKWLLLAKLDKSEKIRLWGTRSRRLPLIRRPLTCLSPIYERFHTIRGLGPRTNR